MIDLEIAAGSVVGTQHAVVGKPCQDAWCVVRDPSCIVAVVSDGVSQGDHSEVGAHILSTMMAHALARSVVDGPFRSVASWTNATFDVTHALDKLMVAMGGKDADSRRALVLRYFAATLVACVITPEYTEIASIGDGWAAVNGAAIQFDPYPDNTPPALAYRLCQTTMDPDLLRWKIRASLPTSELQSFAIGTDGMVDYCAEERTRYPHLPGVVGSVADLWTDDRYFRNRDALRRKLAVCQGGAVTRAGGLLPDDTTVVVGRRKASPEVPVAPGVFTRMGVGSKWILTPKNDPSEIRRSFQMFSRSAARASVAAGAGNFNNAAAGGFASP